MFPILTKFLVIQNFGKHAVYCALHGLCVTKILYFEVNLPLGNLSEPSEFGLEQVFHFHLNTDDDASIGVW
jgi:hypothetical protein